eukprot:11895092-Prorocentrum_lima.AAC.1
MVSKPKPQIKNATTMRSTSSAQPASDPFLTKRRLGGAWASAVPIAVLEVAGFAPPRFGWTAPHGV